ncbi:MAG: hypothetical protein ACK4K0_01455 [Flavobacteriales bacterium]
MLPQLVEQLSDKDFTELQTEFVRTGGDNFLYLLNSLREAGFDDAAVKNKLGLSSSAYYTLKSRLTDKIQDHLFKSNSDERAELMINLSSVSHFTYGAPKATAIGLLERLEKELLLLDMPGELVSVYNALKKLHHSTEKYYQFQQKYNKNVAYSLAIDKAEDLLLDFNKTLGEYNFSRNHEKKTLLQLYIKELRNINKLYESNRLKLFMVVAELEYALLSDSLNNIPDSENTVEDLLKVVEEIVFAHPEDRQYKFYIVIYYLLYFEYYHKLGLHKNNQSALSFLLENYKTFFNLSDTFYLTRFFISLNERINQTGETFDLDQLIETSSKHDSNEYPPDIINKTLGLSAIEFAKSNYAQAEAQLNNLLNNVSLKNYFFADLEVKSFLSLVYILQKKLENADIVLRSITRKLSSMAEKDEFENANMFFKLLKASMNHTTNKEQKIKKMYADFELYNSRHNKILSYLKINETHLKILSQ